jgi:hypothetical protein
MGPRRKRLSGLATLAAVAATAAALAAAVGSRPSASPRDDQPLALEVRSVPLDPQDPARETVGELRFRGGLWLSSDDPRFGGLSDLRVSEDGSVVYAVSDCGRGFVARLDYDASGRLVGLRQAGLIDLVGPGGRPLTSAEVDAESLVEDDGRLEVGFEGRARRWSYARRPPFGGPPRALTVPAGTSACGSNSGIETMAALSGGGRLLICEGRREASTTVPAWIGSGESWTQREYPLRFDGGWMEEPFRPTAGTLLPDGSVLVLERRFPPIGARVVRLAPADLEGRGPLEPRELARFEAPLTLDNFEGIDARRDASGETLVYVVSDDNGCSKIGGGRRTGLQRTLLLLFTLGAEG